MWDIMIGPLLPSKSLAGLVTGCLQLRAAVLIVPTGTGNSNNGNEPVETIIYNQLLTPL